MPTFPTANGVGLSGQRAWLSAYSTLELLSTYPVPAPPTPPNTPHLLRCRSGATAHTPGKGVVEVGEGVVEVAAEVVETLRLLFRRTVHG